MSRVFRSSGCPQRYKSDTQLLRDIHTYIATKLHVSQSGHLFYMTFEYFGEVFEIF